MNLGFEFQVKNSIKTNKVVNFGSDCGMGISISCPFATYNDIESGLESVVVKSVSLGDDEVKTPRMSISFKNHDDSKPLIVKKSLGSGKMVVEGSVSFKQRDMDTLISINASPSDKEEDDIDMQSPKLNGNMDPVDEEEPSVGKHRSSLHLRNNSSEEDLVPENAMENDDGNTNKTNKENLGVLLQGSELALGHHPVSSHPHSRQLSRKLTYLQIPRRDELLVRMQSENVASEPGLDDLNMDDGYDSATEGASASEKDEKSQKDDIMEEQEAIPAESILQRINSHKETKSYQLGKQLSCKWTTGAGPRIGCVRDYPSELQFRALEQVNLSPRSASGPTKSAFSPNTCGGGLSSESSMPIPIVSRRCMGQCRMQASPLSKGRKCTL
ncbi:hypothetical protein Cgig2_016896 [Carnegiea gigantea]|uniref:Uncharacterized protein n=1 Tax=Carnegiea gigantea TaxID=171969 RepID=A0A9Q1K5I8_9CARY|nr:hypothetical protein Cgig2_016896 [Carnegiea gigantea]